MIAKMNKFTFLIYHKDYETFLEKLRNLGVVHVEVRQSGEMEESMRPAMQKYVAYKTLLKDMSACAAQYACTGLRTSASSIEKVKADYDAFCVQLQAQTANLSTLDKEIKALEPWGSFDWSKLDALKDNGWNVQFFSCPERNFNDAWQDEYNAIVINKKEGQCYFVTIGQQTASIDAEALHLPHEDYAKLLVQKEENEKLLEDTRRSMSEYCARAIPVVESAIAAMQDEIDLMKVRLGGEPKADGALILLEGWAPSENSPAVQSMLEQCDDVYFEMRPAEKEDNAPIKLKNNRITRLFEALTRMYGLPDYGEFDPTPLLAPFYALFFGLCLGDAGYGLFLVLLGFFLKKKVSQSMQGIMNLLITLGVAATVVGAVLGTFFGVDLVKTDIPQAWKDFMISGEVEIGGKMYYKTMILALVVGMIHICFAMTVKAVCSTVRYGFKNSLSDWGWLLLVGGSVSVATLKFLDLIPAEAAKIAYYVIGGISAVGIFLLNNLHRNVFMNAGAGLWTTYNMATGLMGDLLSYLRLYALGLAGGLLGGVFNDLGMQAQSGMSNILWGIPGWIVCGLIFVCGHALNIALSCLSAYVHSIRLTFVEYFKNSGYDGRGTMYKPFSSFQKTENKEIN